MTASQNGSSIFPLIMPTQVITAEFLQDAYVQLLELINSQCQALATKATGTFVANGATPVAVTGLTNFAITDLVIISLNTVGGTVGATPAVKTVTAGTGFTVAATASDTSTYNYKVVSGLV